MTDQPSTLIESWLPFETIGGEHHHGSDGVGIAEARHDLSTLINRVVYEGERIILTSRGKPKAAIISLDDLHQLKEMEKTVDRSA